METRWPGLSLCNAAGARTGHPRWAARTLAMAMVTLGWATCLGMLPCLLDYRVSAGLTLSTLLAAV